MTFTSIDWPQVSALAACAGVIIALISHVKNLATAWLSNSSKMVLDLSASFNATTMRKHRSAFAARLLEARSQVNLHHDSPVLGFLEEIGYMTRRGVLDRGMVWNSFFWALERYYLALTASPNLLLQARTESKTIYREIEWLYKELGKISVKERGLREYVARSVDDVTRFLENERALVPSPVVSIVPTKGLEPAPEP